MQTASGGKFFFLDPRPEEIDIRDIAHHLSMLCRWNGACRRFYSVAEHSVNVYRVVWTMTKSPHLALSALLHDAHEAYLGDITKPAKMAMQGLCDPGSEPHYFLSKKIQEAINRKFGCPPGKPLPVDVADVACLFAEARALMPPESWHRECPAEIDGVAQEILIAQRAPEETPYFAAQEFLRVFGKVASGEARP